MTSSKGAECHTHARALSVHPPRRVPYVHIMFFTALDNGFMPYKQIILLIGPRQPINLGQWAEVDRSSTMGAEHRPHGDGHCAAG